MAGDERASRRGVASHTLSPVAADAEKSRIK